MADEVAGRIELEYRRRGGARFRCLGFHRDVLFLSVERSGTMDDPHVILGIHGDPDCRADHPMVRQRFRPHGIHFEFRGHCASGFHVGHTVQNGRAGSKRGDYGKERDTDAQITSHFRPPDFSATRFGGSDYTPRGHCFRTAVQLSTTVRSEPASLEGRSTSRKRWPSADTANWCGPALIFILNNDLGGPISTLAPLFTGQTISVPSGAL